jgi:hypothetical protein
MMTRFRVIGLCVAMFVVCVYAPARASATDITVKTDGGTACCIMGKTFTFKEDSTVYKEVKAAILTNDTGNTWHNFEFSGSKCESTGAKEGEVKTEPLTAELGYVNKAKGEVGLKEGPSKGELLTRFKCGENTIEIRGSVIGSITPINKLITSEGHFALEWTLVEGKQAITKFEGGSTVQLEAQINGGGFHSITYTEDGTATPSSSLEISTKGGTPEFT